MKNRFNLNEEEKNRIKNLHNINVDKEQSKKINITEDDSILDDAMNIVNEKTMLEKVELFRQMVSEIAIDRYEQNEFADIVREISLEVFSREDIDTLRNLESS
tara:strand:- start:265 stop:573 length:309 start_codon:yes stop_codon:yes gene_type:complete